MKRLTMINGDVHTVADHPDHHETTHRAGRGTWCHDCQDYITTYDP